MADANVTSLQIAINRYASTGAFSPIGVDGTMGPNTANGTLKALAYVSSNSQNADDVTTSQGLVSRLVTSSGAIDQNQVQQSASGLSQFLNGCADELGLAAGIAQPITTVASGGGILPVSLTPAAVSSDISALWAKLPTWQKVVAGVVAGLAVLFVYNHVKHNGPTLKGLLGDPSPRRRHARHCGWRARPC